MGHTTDNLAQPMFRRMLYSFHMPLFFMLSGMSMSLKPLRTLSEFRDLLKKNVLSLLVPYLIWGLIYSQSGYSLLPNLLYGSWEGLDRLKTLTSLWYLTCFFCARIYVALVLTALDRLRVRNAALGCAICAPVIFAVGMLLPHPENGAFLCCDIAFTAAAFILVGIAFKKICILFSQQKTLYLVLAAVISAVCFACGTILRGDALSLSLMCKAAYGNVFWFVFDSLAGSALVMSVSMLIARLSRESAHPFSTAAISYIGQRTMGIYLVHKQLMYYLLMPVLNRLLEPKVPAVLISLIAAGIMLPVCCGLCAVIERTIPQLFGQFPKKQNAPAKS